VKISEISGGHKMQNFVLSGKAKTVFKLIELKAKREEAARRDKKHNSGKK
jgi:hypothetical protein